MGQFENIDCHNFSDLLDFILFIHRHLSIKVSMNNHKLVFKLFFTDIAKQKWKIKYEETHMLCKKTWQRENNMENSQYNKIFNISLIIFQLLNLK